MNVVVATDSSTLMRWWRVSLLASPTLVPASTVPWRWIAPVRARIASNSVVLPLWNGPTSAMHRGPLGLVPPFCAMRDSLGGRAGERWRDPDLLWVVTISFQARAPLARVRKATPRAARNFSCAGITRASVRFARGWVCWRTGAPSRPQPQLGDADREIKPGLALLRQRLQRHAATRSAHQRVGADPGGDGRFSARPHIGTGEPAVTARGRLHHRPHHAPARRLADVEPELGNRSHIRLVRPARLV